MPTDTSTKVVDANDQPINVGSRVVFDDDRAWIVTRITDPDGDVDDEGRSIGIPPYVRVEREHEMEELRTYWTAEGWWDEGAPYKCDDLVVAS